MSAPIATGRLAALIDLILLGVLLLLYAPRLTGLPVHEWVGLALAVPLVVHLLLSWKWIAATTRRVIARRDARARVNYLLNGILFVLIGVEVTSGIVISQVALPVLGVRTINDRAWRALHNLTLNYTLLALGLHVAMNWRPLLVALRRLLPGDWSDA